MVGMLGRTILWCWAGQGLEEMGVPRLRSPTFNSCVTGLQISSCLNLVVNRGLNLAIPRGLDKRAGRLVTISHV